jgi:UDP-hydrolysing UDP-N-acetyl-D-glucosamine 2-epimerase
VNQRKRIAVLTTGRQDYGILRSTLLALRDHPAFELRLWAGGMHLSARFGRTVERIADDGLTVDREIAFLHEPPSPCADTAAAVEAVGAALAAEKPDCLLVAGDRTEVLAAALAATIACVPIAHLHGGEETEGAIDNAVRHALTKLSHLHLVSHARYAERVLQMGEDPRAVVVTGAPGLDNRYRDDLPQRAELERRLGIALRSPVVIATVHPATLGAAPLDEAIAVAHALSRCQGSCVITQPNADAGGEAIRSYWTRWCAGRANVVLVDALGEAGYWALMREASAVIGNSSSGLIEAPAAGVPVVNVGDRQRGRLRLGRVWDVAAEPAEVERALNEAIAAGRNDADPSGGFPSGPAAPRIVKALEEWVPPVPPRKIFRDVPWRSA